METEISDPGVGQVVPSLNTRGNDDFSALIGSSGSGKSGGNQQQQQQQGTEPLEKSIPKKAAEPDQQQTQQGQQTSQTQQSVQEGQKPAQSSQTTPSGVDPKIIDQIVEAATKAAVGARSQDDATRAAAAQVKQDQKTLTPEEFNAKYQLEAITPEVLQKILDQDPKKGAAELQRIMLRNIGSAVLMAKDVFDRQLEQVRGEMKPHLDSWQTFQKRQQEEALTSQFYDAHKDLVNEKALVKEMQDALFGRIASGQMKPFNSSQDAFKAVADATRAVLARMNKQAAAGGGQQQQSQQSGQGTGGSSRQMTAASSAGQSGAGHTAGKSDEEKIFGSEWR